MDVFDHEGKSALHLAAEKGSIEVCEALLARNAFINSKTKVNPKNIREIRASKTTKMLIIGWLDQPSLRGHARVHQAGGVPHQEAQRHHRLPHHGTTE